MKKIKVLLLAVTSIFILGSCSSDSGSGGSGTYYVKSNVNGAASVWSSQVEAHLVNLDSESVSLVILAANSSGGSMNISITDESSPTLVPKSFPLDYAVVNCSETKGLAIFSSNYEDFSTSPGSVVVTEINTTNKTIKGTYSFIGKTDPETTSRTHTGGEFFVKYTTE